MKEGKQTKRDGEANGEGGDIFFHIPLPLHPSGANDDDSGVEANG